MAVQNVLLEIVHELADIDGRQRVFAKSEIPPLLTRLQKPVMLSSSRARCQYTIGLAEYILHTLRLVIKVPVRALDDAN